MFNKETYINRRNALKNSISNGIAIFLGNTDLAWNYRSNTYKFRQDSTFLYFFGLNEPDLAAIINFETGEEVIFGNDNLIEDIIWMGETPTLASKADQCGVSKTSPFNSIFDVVEKALSSKQTIHILPPYRSETSILFAKLLSCNLDSVAQFVSEALIESCVALRSTKEQQEIEEIERGSIVAHKMFLCAMNLAQSGAKEFYIAGQMEGIAMSHNGAVSFPIILSKNGQILHNHSHNNTLSANDLLLVDAGFESALGYATDNTRTIPVGGKFTQQQKEIYSVVYNAMLTALAVTKPGVTYLSVHLTAAKAVVEGLSQLGIMKGIADEAVAAGAHALFFPHGIGHMMGLDVHDMENYGENFVGYNTMVKRSSQFGLAYLRMARTLEPNFIVTNEPGIYFIPQLIDIWANEKRSSAFINYDALQKYRNFGGIRLEDDILVTHDGARILGERIPISIEEVEGAMKK